jgi:hypothetical protein
VDASGCGPGGEKLDWNGGHFVPGAAFEAATVALFEATAPLFEVQGDAGLAALEAMKTSPAWACARRVCWNWF